MNKKLLTMGLAALLMAGCSSDDVVGEGDNGGTVNGTAYVGLKLQLPSVNGSRAGEIFEAATPAENTVNTLDVVFLNNANEVVQHKPIAIEDLHWTDDPATGIGTVAELPVIKMTKSDVQKVLILVNNQGNVTIPAVGNTIDVTTAKGVSNLTASGFFMTNALLTDGNTSSYLVPVTPQKTIAEAQAEASNNVIYVERAAAKVTVAVNPNYIVPNSAAEDYRDSEVKFSGWLLDVTNTKFYPVHQMDNKYFSDEYISSASATAFIGGNLHKGRRFYETVATPQRVYWATAPYYTDAAVISGGSATFTVATDATPESSFKAFGNLAPQYCAENTFTVQQMMQTHTTRTLLKATYKPAKVMLKQTGEVDWSLQTPPVSGADVVASDITDGMTWYRLGNSSNAWVDKSLKARLLKYFQVEAGMTGATAVTIENVKAGTHAFSEDLGGGEKCNVVKVTSGGGTTEIVGANLDNLRQAFGKLTAFVNGVCYYQVRIKHFGATPNYTPWGNETNAPTLTGLADAYTNYLTYGTDETKKTALDKEYLGRYGVVRNNYYDININSVSGPGEPTINDITPTTDPDDQQNYYIQATVKILDWAKRSQSVDL